MSGIADSNLVVLAPVTPGAGAALRDYLESLPEGERSPFAHAPGTHFGRWTFVEALPGPGDRPVREAGPFLLMCADFDGSVREWTTALCRGAAVELDAVFRHCPGYPGSADPEAVASFFSAHAAPRGFTVAGYRATVPEVRGALALRVTLRELALRTQGLPPDELRRAWRTAIAR